MSATITPIRPPDPSLPAPPPMAVHAYMQTILDAATRLMRAGHEILAFHAEVVSAQPIIWVRDTPGVRALVTEGSAAYDRSGIDDRGPWRVGLMTVAGVRVQWFERAPS